ncbi:MAG: H(+)/Cl(-) exchange transporter ClcA [Chloroflexaceae bacterium]
MQSMNVHSTRSAVNDTSDARTNGDQRVEALSEIQEYLDVSQQRRRVLPRAILVGLAAGVAAVIFRSMLAGADSLRNALIAWSHQQAAVGWIVPVLFSAAGATLAVLLVQRFAPEAKGSGIPHLKGVLHRLRTMRWARVVLVKMIGSTLALGSGLALGREGPSVQIGGAIGDGIARGLKAAPRERLTLTAAGAGAGLAAAFNAPLSGVMFVLEEVQRDFRPIVFGAAFISAVVADIVTRLVSGQRPAFAIPAYAAPPLTAMPMFAMLGLLAGVLGVAFNRSLLAIVDRSGAWSDRKRLMMAAIIGAGIGLIGWFSPIAIGGGHTLAEDILNGHIAVAAVLLWFMLRFGMTIISYSTGAPGGIFAPLLVLGALIGTGAGVLAQWLAPQLAPQPTVFAVAGMAAYFTAIVRAPLTGIVLIIEMTGNYEQMLALLVSCFCAYAVAETVKDLPIYEALLERDLVRGGLHLDLKEPVVIDLVIKPGAPFDGRQVSELGLPPGCILVRCQDGSREWIPTASTRLEAHMRITAMVSPRAGHGLSLLRRGCESDED